MLETITVELDEEQTDEAIWSDVLRVCERIPPLWDLPRFVAVNPFLGYVGRPWLEAAGEIADGLDARVLPSVDFYRARWRGGAFGRITLEPAARRVGLDVERLIAILEGRIEPATRPPTAVLTFAERHDQRHGGDWRGAIQRSVARWCAVHAMGGGLTWKTEVDGQGLYASWREAESIDRLLEIAGLRGWRRWVQRSPARPDAAIAEMLRRLAVPAENREAYLYRLLGGLHGWASYFRRSTWSVPGVEPGTLADLLAILICADAAVAELAPHAPGHYFAPRSTHRVVESQSDLTTLGVFQEALEDAYSRRLIGSLRSPSVPAPEARPAVQGVFCIDVRSERFRRALESISPRVETLGFAGFFGVAFDWGREGSEGARCPVQIKPTAALAPSKPLPTGWLPSLLKQIQNSPSALFSFVEITGLAYVAALAMDALWGVSRPETADDRVPFTLEPDSDGGGYEVSARIDLAASILKNMGLRRSMARLVLLCGHEASGTNNSHQAGLNCGACGGRGGGINARVAAAILNDAQTRSGLALRGWAIPEDTFFAPAVHDTTIDQVRLLDLDHAPASHQADLDQLRGWLGQAGSITRAERAGSLGLAGLQENTLDRRIRRRARQSSQTRPEWGLARNAAFLAAPRGRSRGVDLEGRVFLHDYDWNTDPDDSILTMILTAPVVVASWINLQYYASTVDNQAFGAGTKALHNRLGSLGVILGNGGDLRSGLALQSVQGSDGEWFHEPLRLQVVVEAPRLRVERVLANQSMVRDLVENGWVRLFAIDPDSDVTARWIPGEGWSPIETRIQEPGSPRS